MQELTQEEVDSIRNNPDQQDWDTISYWYILSENFIREFQDKVDWCWISCNQKLSEAFMREFQDKVYWNWIAYSQAISEEFIREFQDRFGRLDVSAARRPVTYDEIMSYDPCPDGVERYLEHTKKKETITWETLLERHSYKGDIGWLFNKRR